MRIAICDDDEKMVLLIKNIILDFYAERKLNTPRIDIFYTGDSLLKDKDRKDLVFLDVEMPGLDGILTGKKLQEENKNLILIIITSYAEYLDDAMRINVFRYISKPIDVRRFKRNLSDAIGAYNSKKSKMIAIDTAEGVMRFKSSEMYMFEMIGRKVTVYTADGPLVTRKNMKEWQDVLPEEVFYQCHRSFIVNISHIRRICADKILMDIDDLEAYLTKRKYTEIKKKWMLYLESAN